MASEKKAGGLPVGIFAQTTRPEPEAAELVEQGGPAQLDAAPVAATGATATRTTAPAATGADVGDDGAKLYLSADVRFRLRMLAYQRGKKISAVANEVLDKALPRWNLERTE